MAVASQLVLICSAGETRCALPVRHVAETMRPLPLASLPESPDFVAGMSIIRGVPVPIVSVDRLLGQEDSETGRIVVVRSEQRRVGLAFSHVNGFRVLPADAFQQLPLLLATSAAAAVAQIAVLDGDLLTVLSSVGIVPESVFSSLAALAS